MNDLELKPCPFCGSREEVAIDTSYYHNGSGRCIPVYSTVCRVCFCKTRTFKTKEAAAKAWNRRKENE